MAKRRIPAPKTVIQLSNIAGELDRIEIPYDDATDAGIAQAAIALIASTGYSLAEGDWIRVFAVDADETR